MDKVTFPASSAFFIDVRARVDAYFAGRSRDANGKMIAKTVFWIVSALALWAVNAFGVLPFPLTLLTWGALGFAMACIGFNVGHDAIHKSYSRHAWVNAFLSRSFDFLGAASSTWAHSHNVVHHTFTNVRGVDSDLEPGPWMRFYPKDEPPPWVYRLQQLYAWFFYGFTMLVWVFVKDFVQLREQKASKRVIVDVVLGKLLHFAAFIALPVAYAGLWSLVGYVIMLAVAGVTLATVFQLAHCVEGVTWPKPPADGAMPEPWADTEMRTTANFGRSWLTTFFTGGLDHQIEHHLFPRVCHIHYPALAPIVEQCARDHGLPYLHSGSFFSAVASHARTLGRLGRGEIAPAT